MVNGIVTPKIPGTTTITATTVDGGFAKTISVTVKAGDIYVKATDADFSGEADGEFKYIGSADYVEIPHVIKGVPVTSYKEMFEETFVKGVRSTNKNVTTMYSMFRESQATSLDVSSLDTSNVTNMASMFYESKATLLDLSSFDTANVIFMYSIFEGSQATAGTAKSQADADRFNGSSGKPAGLTFVVKGEAKPTVELTADKTLSNAYYTVTETSVAGATRYGIIALDVEKEIVPIGYMVEGAINEIVTIQIYDDALNLLYTF